jgi:hypothetical protein
MRNKPRMGAQDEILGIKPLSGDGTEVVDIASLSLGYLIWLRTPDNARRRATPACPTDRGPTRSPDRRVEDRPARLPSAGFCMVAEACADLMQQTLPDHVELG